MPDDTTALYCAAIGPIRTNYYLTRFIRFEELDKAGISWNWAACLNTLNWMAFRQLWAAALAYVGALVTLALMVFGVGRLMFAVSSTTAWLLALALGALAFVVPGLFGNAVFYAYNRKKMTQALQASEQVTAACALLDRTASTRKRMLWVVVANVALLAAMVGIYTIFSHVGAQANTALQRGAPSNLAVGRTTDASANPIPSPIQTPASAPASAETPAPIVLPTPAPAPAASEVLAPPIAAPKASQASAPTPAKPKALPVPPKSTEGKASAQRYVINVGLFAKDENAANAQTKLTEAGLTVSTQTLDTQSGKRTRVRVGPFETEAKAKAAAQKVQTLKLDAIIVQQ